MNNLSQAYLLKNGFEQKQGDEEYFENVLTSKVPQVTIYVFTDSTCMQIGGSGEMKDLNIESEEQMTVFISALESVMQ